MKSSFLIHMVLYIPTRFYNSPEPFSLLWCERPLQKEKYKSADAHRCFLHSRQPQGESIDIEKQEQKFDQFLDQLSHNTTRLTNTLVCRVTERSPQLYLKTQPHLPSCIGGLSKAVVKVQQARNKLCFFRQKVGLASTEELCSPLLAKGKKKKVARERLHRPLHPPNEDVRRPQPKLSLFLWTNGAMIEFLSHSNNRH